MKVIEQDPLERVVAKLGEVFLDADVAMLFDQMTQVSWIYDLCHLGQSVTSLETADSIYQQLLDHFAKGFGATGGCLALCQDDGQHLKIVATIESRDGQIGVSLPIGGTVLGQIVHSGRSVLLADAASSRALCEACSSSRCHPARSAIGWPLSIHGRIIGTITLSRTGERPPFDARHIEQGTTLLNLVSLVLGNIKLQIEQHQRIKELKQANRRLEEAHSQLLQSEKMASIGQLAAGVAHEINNPIGYVNSNLGALESYLGDLFSLIDAYEAALAEDAPDFTYVRDLTRQIDLPFLREDLLALMAESREGITRVKKIVQDLKEFSHTDASDEWQVSDLHQGLESTLNIVANEIKYKATVVKEYAQALQVECLPSQINQVFMNLLVNAAQAIDGQGTIVIRTGLDDQEAWVEIADTGKGMPPEVVKRIFDPFFTTKPVGKGTGLGLSLSYGIVQKHQGRIEVASQVGEGTTFRIYLPLRRPAQA